MEFYKYSKDKNLESLNIELIKTPFKRWSVDRFYIGVL